MFLSITSLFLRNSTVCDQFSQVQLSSALCTICLKLYRTYWSLQSFDYLSLIYFESFKVDNLNATASQQAMVTGLLSLPWALKIGCGFLSDSFPIGAHSSKQIFVFMMIRGNKYQCVNDLMCHTEWSSLLTVSQVHLKTQYSAVTEASTILTVD